MTKFAALIFSELKKPLWHSPLQMSIVAILAYYLSMIMGPAIACGAGDRDIANSVFSCSSSDMGLVARIVILTGMACGSLCLARAVTLLDKSRLKRINS